MSKISKLFNLLILLSSYLVWNRDSSMDVNHLSEGAIVKYELIRFGN